VYDWRTDEFAVAPDGWPGPSPWETVTIDGVEIDNVAYGCPVHGELFALPDGSQKFSEPDTWVLGPNGERLFCV